jgi:hypothetical protein
MDMREDAQGPVIAVKMSVMTLGKGKARPPHERSVAENPQIIRGVFRVHYECPNLACFRR